MDFEAIVRKCVNDQLECGSIREETLPTEPEQLVELYVTACSAIAARMVRRAGDPNDYERLGAVQVACLERHRKALESDPDFTLAKWEGGCNRMNDAYKRLSAMTDAIDELHRNTH